MNDFQILADSFFKKGDRAVRFATLQLLLLVLAGSCIGAETGTLKFLIADAHGEPVPCRIHLRNSAGIPQQAEGLPYWRDHFVCSGNATLQLSPDEYSWEIERGPEFRRLSGTTKVQSGTAIVVTQTLAKLVALRDEGWYSGDLHVHRAVSEIELLMSAEDLDFAPVIQWWNKPWPDAAAAPQTEFRFGDGRVYCTGAGEDEREGGALLYFGLNKPLDLTVKSREFPSPMLFVQQARQQNQQAWIDIEKPFWWDVPTWIAVARPDSIGIAHNHMHRSGVLGNEAWGRPRDLKLYPGVKGNGFWTQQIYYHLLNCGIRIPPSAGSASGVLPNPVGYNRVYVQLGDAELNRANWFDALKAGRSFVTNGPLLRVKANGQWPGATMQMGDGLNIRLEIELASNDRVSQLEVIHNGNVIKRIPCDDRMQQSLDATVQVSEPGWFLVRAFAEAEHTFRFASTAPWYLQGADNRPRISRLSAQFFVDWIDERIDRVNQNVPDLSECESVLRWHIEAREFWTRRLQESRD